MDPGRWLVVSGVFAAAAALDRGGRDAYLDVACRDDVALRAAVDSMLAAHDAAGSFGDRPLLTQSPPVKRLAAGSRIGPFRIEALLGAGGMGEVYRAHDTKLRRSVALKVLPDVFAHDADRRARFAHEAEALAALNHPYIGTIYGVEESGDAVALVLELVEGPTLAERLAAGPMSTEEIATAAAQIAEALEAAHDRGIVHRDLKPANLKFTPDGVIKVLDFGLAKAGGPPVSSADAANATAPGTDVGAIVGTAAYMSPEQARGHAVDKRADIWAFGCVVFELCAGRPPFGGATVSDTLTAVIEREPDWTLVGSSTPQYLLNLLRRCLTKDPKQRLRDIGEARIALARGPGQERMAAGGRWSRSAKVMATIAACLAVSSIATAVYVGRTPLVATAPQIQFLVFPPDGGAFNRAPARTFFALSPDGSQLAFVAATDRSRVWLRAMANLEARPVPGTEGATSVFWSPDGRSIAFFADAKLKRADLPDGAVVTICDLPAAALAHGTWGADGSILVGSSAGTAIHRVAAAGGPVSELLTPNRQNREARVHWPTFLPDGQRFLYTARRDDGDGEVRIGALDSASTRALMPVTSNTAWVDPDVVVFAREGVLLGQRVDLNLARTVGEPFSIAEHVDYLTPTSRGLFSASFTGTVAYHPHGDLAQLVWADQHGNETGTISGPAEYDLQSTRLSSDGTVLLTSRRQHGPGTFDIWRHDLARGIEQRLTDDRGVAVTPILIDDDRALVFATDRNGAVPSVFRKDLVTGVEEQLLPSGLLQKVMDVIPGERAIIYVQRSKHVTFELFKLPLLTGAPPIRILESRLDTVDARVSPDGRAIAFAASDSQEFDLYVAPLPVTRTPLVAAANISNAPRWSSDGRRLYYLGDDHRVMTIAVQTQPSLSVGAPQEVFQLKRPAMLLDVSRDGRFLLLVPVARAGERPISVAIAAVGDDRP
jgi:Tol biopolymer transport system component